MRPMFHYHSDCAKSSVQRGQQKADEFLMILKAYKIPYRLATRKEDLCKKIDFFITLEKEISCNYKAQKGIKRGQLDDTIWVEFINGWNNPGWLIAPDLDTIIFQQGDNKNYFVLSST